MGAQCCIAGEGPRDGLVRRVHDVEIEEAVHQANVERGHRIRRDELDGARMDELEVLDDDGGLDDVTRAIDEDGEAREGPAPEPLRDDIGVVGPDLAEVEGEAVLVEGRLDLLRVRREVVTEELERHGGYSHSMVPGGLLVMS